MTGSRPPAPAAPGRRRRPSSRATPSASVERCLRLLEPALDHRVERVDVLVRLEVGEDVGGGIAAVAAARTSDADAQPQELRRAELLRDRAQSVVAREPAAEADLQAARFEVELVVYHEDRAGLELEEASRGGDGLPGEVHVRLRLQQRDAGVSEPHFYEPAAELRAPRAAVPAYELVHDEPADVVAVARVLAPGVAESRDEQVERRGALAPAPEERHLALGRAGLAGLAAVRLALGRRRGLALGGNLALGQLALFAFLDLDLGLLEARRDRQRRDHGVGVVEEGDSGLPREVGDAERVADRHSAHVEVDVLGNLHRQGLDVDLARDL